MSNYIYHASDFQNNEFLYPQLLQQTIKEDSIINKNIQYIMTAGDDVTIYFDATLTPTEKSRLDLLVANYVNEYNPNNTFIIQEQYPIGTNAGSSSSKVWIQRRLNYIQPNDDHSITITGNNIICEPGEYTFRIVVPAGTVTSHQARLFNNTTNSVESYGMTSTSNNPSIINTTISVPTISSFQIQHKCNRSVSNTGLGAASGFGMEIYTSVQIVKKL